MSNVVDYKCPGCSAKLNFDPKSQLWHCDYCGKNYEKDKLIDKYQDKVVKEEVNENYNVYRCSNCGAEIVADLNTSSTFCVYCKSNAIIKERLVGKFEPNAIIPFSKTIEDAKDAFKKVGKKHPLMPSDFNSEKNISEIRGIYIPFWLFSGTTSGGIRANCEKITHWTSGNYRYTKTDLFHVIREGKYVVERVPNDGSLKFDDAIMNSIEPFDYKKMVNFDASYLSGFLSEKFDVNSDDVKANIIKRVVNSVAGELQRSIHFYNSCIVTENSIQLNDIKCEYVLLPVYLLNIKYKDKIYTFAMNGESGKFIGNMPIDIKKLLLILFGSFFAIALICYLIFYIFIRSVV